MGVSLRQVKIEQLYQEIERRGKIDATKDLLLMLSATGAITIGIIIAPKLTSFVCKILFQKTRKPQYLKESKKIKRVLYRLRQQELIDWRINQNGQTIITLTDRGKQKILKYKVNEIKIRHSKHWDQKWRIIIFDIPETHKLARDILREKLKTLGFYQLQKSVWVYPYYCKKEVDFISHVYGVGKYLLYLETKNLENEEFLRNKFNLLDSKLH